MFGYSVECVLQGVLSLGAVYVHTDVIIRIVYCSVYRLSLHPSITYTCRSMCMCIAGNNIMKVNLIVANVGSLLLALLRGVVVHVCVFCTCAQAALKDQC